MKPPAPPRPPALLRPPMPPRPLAPAARPGGRKGIPPLSALDPVPDPLAGLPDMPDPVDSASQELTALQEGFRQRAKTEGDRFKTETDTEHWFTINFETREQKEAFLAGKGWMQIGDKYLDGRVLAGLEGIAIPEGGRRYNTSQKVDKTLKRLR